MWGGDVRVGGGVRTKEQRGVRDSTSRKKSHEGLCLGGSSHLCHKRTATEQLVEGHTVVGSVAGLLTQLSLTQESRF